MHLLAHRFQSTLPVRGATSRARMEAGTFFISIHAPREGSDIHVATVRLSLVISIHAPREGSDYLSGRLQLASQPISIHAPREGSDLVLSDYCKTMMNFNPRSP